jgi:prolyl 4-hydroxylase
MLDLPVNLPAVDQVLTWHPRIFLLHDFLTAAECDELIALALPELEASTVVDTATGGGFLSQVRTSSGMFIMENTPVTKVIRQRIAHLTLLPGMQRIRCRLCRLRALLTAAVHHHDRCRGKPGGNQRVAIQGTHTAAG